jgi:hypothetical protein
LEIGFAVPVPKEGLEMFKYQQLAPIVDQIKGVDQRIHLYLELGASLKDMLSGEEPLLAQLNKGLKLKVAVDVMANFKKVIFAVLKDPALGEVLGPFAFILAPIVLLQMNASLNLTFDDFEELKELPMMEPLLANFGQLFEGISGSDVETLTSERITEYDGEEVPAYLKRAVEAQHTLFDILQNTAP